MPDWTRVLWIRLIRRSLLAVVLLFGPLSAVAHAQMGMTTIVGGDGGGYFAGRCSDDNYLVGLNWTGGKDVVTIGEICQPFRNGHTDGPATGPQTFGGKPNSEGSGQARCPSDMAVQAITVEVSNANLVHGFTLTCRNPLKHDYRSSSRGGPIAGATNHTVSADCGGGAMAIGIIGRAGATVDALGLRCWVLEAQPPAPASAKPIKSSHGAPDPNALPANPVGSWDMRNGKGEHYVLELSRNGGDVSGTIRDDQGAVSAVTGRIFAGGMLNLHYSLPGRSGAEVVFIKGDTLSGADKASGTPWTGARLAGAADAAGPRATAIDDVDMYSDPDGNSTNLGTWRKGSQATPLASQDGWCKLKGIANGQDAWAWGELVSGCAP